MAPRDARGPDEGAAQRAEGQSPEGGAVPAGGVVGGGVAGAEKGAQATAGGDGGPEDPSDPESGQQDQYSFLYLLELRYILLQLLHRFLQ